MNAEPILCQGHELPGVLAGIRSRGGVVTSLTTGVGGPAGYKVSYFQAESKNGEGVVVATNYPAREIKHSRKLDSLPSTNFERVAKSDAPDEIPREANGSDDSGWAQRPVKVQTPSALNLSPPQCETPAIPAAPEAVKSAVAPRDPFNGHANSSSVASLAGEYCPKADRLGGAETVGVESSIEARMAALQARLEASGKLQRRNPSTTKEHARLPHND